MAKFKRLFCHSKCVQWFSLSLTEQLLLYNASRIFLEPQAPRLPQDKPKPAVAMKNSQQFSIVPTFLGIRLHEHHMAIMAGVHGYFQGQVEKVWEVKAEGLVCGPGLLFPWGVHTGLCLDSCGSQFSFAQARCALAGPVTLVAHRVTRIVPECQLCFPRLVTSPIEKRPLTFYRRFCFFMSVNTTTLQSDCRERARKSCHVCQSRVTGVLGQFDHSLPQQISLVSHVSHWTYQPRGSIWPSWTHHQFSFDFP